MPARSARSSDVIPVGQTLTLFQKAETPDPFKKAVQVVHSRPSKGLSLVEKKIVNAWIKNTFERAPDEAGFYEMPIKELTASIGFNSNNRAHLIDAARSIMHVIFEWDLFSSSRPRWKASVLFPDVEVDPSKVRYRISPTIREELINPSVYALLDMSVIRKARRPATVSLYEFCFRYANLPQTAAVPWRELRDTLLGGETEKWLDEYRRFKDRVLRPAIAELNVISGMTVNLVEIKEGREVKRIQFTLTPKVATESPIEPESLGLLVEIEKIGVPLSEAKKLLAKYDADSVRAALKYTLDRRKASGKGVDNLAAYFRAALQGGYAKSSKSTSPSSAVQTEDTFDLEASLRASRIAEAEQYFKELDEADETALIASYNQQANPLLTIKKRRSKAAEQAFYAWLADHTWGPVSDGDRLKHANELLNKRAAK